MSTCESSFRPIKRQTFVVPVDTVERLRAASFATGTRLGHLVEDAIEAHILALGGPFPPVDGEPLPIGQPKTGQWRSDRNRGAARPGGRKPMSGQPQREDGAIP